MPRLIDLSSVVYHLCESLLANQGYLVFMNNFFTNVRLFTFLKRLGISKYKTTKTNSGFSIKLLVFESYLPRKMIGI